MNHFQSSVMKSEAIVTIAFIGENHCPTDALLEWLPGPFSLNDYCARSWPGANLSLHPSHLLRLGSRAVQGGFCQRLSSAPLLPRELANDSLKQNENGKEVMKISTGFLLGSGKGEAFHPVRRRVLRFWPRSLRR